MWLGIVKWILKMVDISISIKDGALRIVVEFAGTVIIDRSIHIGVADSIEWNASAKGVL